MLNNSAVKEFVSDQLLSWQLGNRDCSFEDFRAEGASSIVVEALKLVSREALRPALYTPLYVRGAAGSGKTYLLNALAGELRKTGVRFAQLDGTALKIGSKMASYDLGFRIRDHLSDVSVVLVDNLEDLGHAACRAPVYAALADMALARKHVVLMADRRPELLANPLESFTRSLRAGIELVLENGTGSPATVVECKSLPATMTIIRAVCDYFRVSSSALRGPRRTASIVHARHTAMYLLRVIREESYPTIGKLLGNRDHTTALHGVDKIEEKIKNDSAALAEIAAIRKALGLAT